MVQVVQPWLSHHGNTKNLVVIICKAGCLSSPMLGLWKPEKVDSNLTEGVLQQ